MPAADASAAADARRAERGYLLRSGAMYGVAPAVQASASLLVLPILTRLLPAEAFGLVAVALIANGVLGLIGVAGLADIAYRTHYADEDGPRIVRSYLLVVVVIACTVAVVAEVAGPTWSAGLLHVRYAAPLRLAVWSSAALAIVFMTQAALRAARRPLAFLVVTGVGTVGAQLLGLLATVLIRADATSYVAGYAAGVTASAALGLVVVGVELDVFHHSWLRLVIQALRLGAPTIPHNLSLYLLWGVDRTIIQRLDGFAAAGRYQVAYPIGGIAIVAVNAFNNAWGPVVFAAPPERRWRVLAETGRLVAHLLAPIIGMLAIAAPIVLLLLAPTNYAPRSLGTTSAIVAAAAFPFLFYVANVHVVVWRGRTGVMAWSAVIALGTNIGLNLILIPPLGLRGAALATLAGYGVHASILAFCARRLARVPWEHRGLLSAAGIAAVSVILAVSLPTTNAWLVVRGAAAAALAAWFIRVVAWALRQVPES